MAVAKSTGQKVRAGQKVKAGQKVVVIGGGPAGLMAAEVLSEAGIPVDLYDAMPSLGRKFLLAGIGGLNITHSEPQERFLKRYGTAQQTLDPLIRSFDAERLRAWVEELGIGTFVGSSGRVFPTEMKAAPLLRAWLKRLRSNGVQFHVRHRWLGFAKVTSPDDPSYRLRFATPEGEREIEADLVILALGGGSWKRLGSDGAWVPVLEDQGVAVAPLKPANCGFEVAGGEDGIGWSAHFRERFAGQPVKAVVASLEDGQGRKLSRQGEFVITESGVEGSLIYALSAPLRDCIEQDGEAVLTLDLAPGRTLAQLTEALSKPRGKDSMAKHLKKQAGIEGVKAGLLRELASGDDFADPARLAAAIKALSLRLARPRPLDEAISSAGGIRFEALDEHLMVRNLPGVFCAGEMLDWEAPTGGYLLTACFATGRRAGQGAIEWLSR